MKEIKMAFRNNIFKIGYTYLFSTIVFQVSCNAQSAEGSWKFYNGDKSVSHYSTLGQIDTNNVQELKIAWDYHTNDLDSNLNTMIQCNPIIIGNILYGTSPQLKLFALDASTGKQKWVFNPKSVDSGKNSKPQVNRGVTFFDDGKDGRILYSVGSYLYEVNAKTGELVDSFGESGRIDLRKNLDRDIGNSFLISSTPGIIYKDLIIIGTRVAQ